MEIYIIIQIDLERLSMVNDKGNIENNILDTLRRIKCLIGSRGFIQGNGIKKIRRNEICKRLS